ncbi:transposase [Lysobacter enzymogenes]|uniref:REP-associated tyrosine transposase n=1 Tax=Lysobacter enzymogenes TaxID=69 RepID=UPI0037482A8B
MIAAARMPNAAGMNSPSDSPGYQALRRGRGPEQQRIYLVTTICIRRRRMFASDHVARIAAAAIADPDKWLGAQLLCWVLMPDHWHGLIQLNSEVRLESVVASMKGRAARMVNRALHRKGFVWMPGFHDRALRTEEELLPAARYIVANPKRAGLVRRVGDYPYWGAVWTDRTASGLKALPQQPSVPAP